MSQSDYYRGLESAQRAIAATTSSDPAALATGVHATVDALLAALPHRHLAACDRGCSHCCHLPVGVTFAEARALGAALGSRPGLMQAVLAAARSSAGLDWDALAGLPCPLLRDGSCALYEVRPVPCRALSSLDADACAAALHRPVSVPVDDRAYVLGLGAAAALGDSMAPTGTRELRSALL
ncbi:MAG: YkgJ family cysteine cluster protein, partial [Planctomycetes bacterium]|nr:YkgJ family cysteine cluster protein [Planctomycetota bacterium]